MLTPEDLARTYNHPSYEDPWECVIDYQRYLEYAGSNPEEGSTAVASTLGLPRSRVRPWMNGSIPDPVRAIQIAEQHEWIPTSLNSPAFRGLNVLLAWVFSGGSIRKNGFVPHFAVSRSVDENWLNYAANQAGLELLKTRKKSERRAKEYRPKANASVLGRVLWILGAPLGEKNLDTQLEIPQYLYETPQVVQREFVAVYIHNRGVNLQEEKKAIRFKEERNDMYLKSLQRFFQKVIGGKVTMHGKNIYLPKDTADIVRQWPVPLHDLVPQ